MTHFSGKNLLAYEKALWAEGKQLIAGVDEVGVGPLAGPVVAAAVILPANLRIKGVTDSKKLTEKQRQALAAKIRQHAVAVGLGLCLPAEIDILNILQASKMAMRRAVWALKQKPDHLLIDARSLKDLNIPETPIIKGDNLSQSIAAASIIAKVARDALMAHFGEIYPGYGFEQHAGYSTKQHFAALSLKGPCPIHRRSFGPVLRAL